MEDKQENKEKLWQIFRQAFNESVANIPSKYFEINISDELEPVWQERAYCYALNHQLNLSLSITTNDDLPSFTHTLYTKFDKKELNVINPKINNKDKEAFNQDLAGYNLDARAKRLLAILRLVFIVVKMANNYSLMEAKENVAKIRNSMPEPYGYSYGIFLIVGSVLEPELENSLKEIKDENILVLWHQKVGKMPTVLSNQQRLTNDF